MISPDLYKAYEATCYRVWIGDAAIALRIGQSAGPFWAALARRQAHTATIITAWNPRSAHTPDAQNRQAQESLRRALKQAGALVLEAVGVPAEASWPPEPSLCGVGLCRRSAVSLARAYGQNAIVWIQRGEQAQLLDCTGEPENA